MGYNEGCPRARVFFDNQLGNIWAVDENGKIVYPQEMMDMIHGEFDLYFYVCKVVMFLEDEAKVGPPEDRYEVVAIVNSNDTSKRWTPEEWFGEDDEEY